MEASTEIVKFFWIKDVGLEVDLYGSIYWNSMEF